MILGSFATRSLRLWFILVSRLALALLTFAMSSSWALFASPVQADGLQRISKLNQPSASTAAIVRNVRTLIEELHVLAPKFNDEISARGFETFLKRIDPKKVFFLESDFVEFQAFQLQLDDQIRENSIAFAYLAYKRFLDRLQQTAPIVRMQIDAPHDFTLDESIAVDVRKIAYAKDQDEISERWRKSIKLQFLSLRVQGKPEEEIRETLHRQFREYYRDATQRNADELLEIYLSSLTNAIDPHTNYKAPLAQESFAGELKLELSGIGASLKQSDGVTLVESLVPGGAAEIDGRLKTGDQIIAIAQEDLGPVETHNMKLREVVQLIRGKTGTRVQLYVKDAGSAKVHLVEIRRALIRLDDAAARSEIVANGTKADGAPFLFGYIRLNSFYRDSEGELNGKVDFRSATRDLKTILNRFRESQVDVVLLDLSKNDSGSLAEAISATGLFVDRGPVVQVKSSDGKVETLEDIDSGTIWDGPLVVKVSHLSTSASEVFAGAIQDCSRGLLVGDPKTHGKGTVQRIVDIMTDQVGEEPSKRYGALKLTIQQFYRPGGRSTQLVGVAPDIVLPSIMAHLDISESDLEFALPSDHIVATQHRSYRMVDDSIVSKLQSNSNSRIAIDKDFEHLQSEIIAFIQQKGDASISLNETQYRTRRSDLTAEKMRAVYVGSKTGGQVYEDHFYNREVLRIAREYVDLLKP